LTDELTPEAVVPLLRGRLGRPYRFVQRAASTQRLLADDDPEGAVVAAGEQTAGRGRLGRRWEAPAGTSLLFSVLLHPAVPPPRLPELSLVAGRAVADANAAVTRLEPAVELPNDVLVGGRKVAGILAEASEGRVVLGIGVNVNQTAAELPRDARRPPTSLRLESGHVTPRAPLLAEILLRLERELEAWVSAAGA
jgi:BirA family biotin operon repressor/biotin-[acetyl-CoA-carboxylase] ligase